MAADLERFCAGVWKDPMNGKVIVLFGENGTGKSICAAYITRWIRKVGHAKQYIDRENNIRFVDVVLWSWPELLDHFKSGNWDSIDTMFDTTVLIIDELGGGHDPTTVGVDKLCQVLSRREKRWTLITTNITPEHWQDKFDRRIASRLNAAQWIDLSGVPDYRLIIGSQADTKAKPGDYRKPYKD